MIKPRREKPREFSVFENDAGFWEEIGDINEPAFNDSNSFRVIEKSAYDKVVKELQSHNCAIIGPCGACILLKDLGEELPDPRRRQV